MVRGVTLDQVHGLHLLSPLVGVVLCPLNLRGAKPGVTSQQVFAALLAGKFKIQIENPTSAG